MINEKNKERIAILMKGRPWINNVRKYHSKFIKNKTFTNNIDVNNTKNEIISEKKFRKIYDCGNIIFSFK